MFKKIIDLSQPTGLRAVPPRLMLSAATILLNSENIKNKKYLRITHWEQKYRQSYSQVVFY